MTLLLPALSLYLSLLHLLLFISVTSDTGTRFFFYSTIVPHTPALLLYHVIPSSLPLTALLLIVLKAARSRVDCREEEEADEHKQAKLSALHRGRQQTQSLN